MSIVGFGSVHSCEVRAFQTQLHFNELYKTRKYKVIKAQI